MSQSGKRDARERKGGSSFGSLPTLNILGTGEPDANVEAAIAGRRRQTPLYIDGFLEPPAFDFRPFENGEKFIVLGQKGTGKTAILRNIEHRLRRSGFRTDYIVFKDSIQDEDSLLDFPFELQIEKKDLKETPIYYHCIKRIFLAAIIKEIHRSGTLIQPDPTDIIADKSSNFVDWLRAFVGRVESSDMGRSVSLVADSIAMDMSQARKLLGIDHEPNASQIRTLLKRLNDRLLTYLMALYQKAPHKVAIFVDEIHFKYSSKDAVRDDAYLVRDVINAAVSLNERFLSQGANMAVFLGVRSEYMSHPVIASADMTKSIVSFGRTIDWSTENYNKNHPMFQLAVQRAAAALRHLNLAQNADASAKKKSTKFLPIMIA